MLTRAMGVSFPAMTFSMETNVVPCSSRLCCSTDGQRQRLDRRNAKEPRRKLEHVFSHTLISMRRVSGKAALGRWAEAEELQGSPAAAVAGPPLEGSSPLRLARRQAMSLPVLLAALISFPQDATSEGAGPCSTSVPSTLLPGVDVFFVDQCLCGSIPAKSINEYQTSHPM